MSNFGDKVQPAVKKETKNVAIYTVVGVVVMWVGFLILHLIWPEKIPFDYRVILGGIGGGAVAVLNFFLMGMAVQKAVSETDEAGAKRRMQASYSQRNLMQMLWAVLAIVLPCFQFAAGILPLLIPGTVIKLMGMAVQKAVSETDEAGAKRRMQASYSQRNLMQMLWAILAIVLPCFQFAAGILPLLIPGTAIKLMGIKNSIKR